VSDGMLVVQSNNEGVPFVLANPAVSNYLIWTAQPGQAGWWFEFDNPSNWDNHTAP